MTPAHIAITAAFTLILALSCWSIWHDMTRRIHASIHNGAHHVS